MCGRKGTPGEKHFAFQISRAETSKGRAVGILRRRWFQIFVSGLILLYLIELTLVATSNPKYVPGILLGAFLVPITFVTYLYEDRVG